MQNRSVVLHSRDKLARETVLRQVEAAIGLGVLSCVVLPLNASHVQTIDRLDRRPPVDRILERFQLVDLHPLAHQPLAEVGAQPHLRVRRRDKAHRDVFEERQQARQRADRPTAANVPAEAVQLAVETLGQVGVLPPELVVEAVPA